MKIKYINQSSNIIPSSMFITSNKNIRVSILTSNLIRVEVKKEELSFLDEPTLSIWNRRLDEVSYTYENKDDESIINIGDKVIHINYQDIEKSFLEVKGNKTFINNDENLHGTSRTLDMTPENKVYFDDIRLKIKDELPLDNKLVKGLGVCSKSGVCYLDDNNTYYVDKDNELILTPLVHDYYIFMYGHDYNKAVSDYYRLTGSLPLPPKYVFGNWWSRYWIYSDKEYLNLMDEFKKKNIPLSVATVDMDWHYVDVDNEFNLTKNGLTDEEFYGKTNGWTGFSFNKHLFSDYKKFLKELKKRNLQVTLNLHPADGIRWFEDYYETACKKLGIDKSTKEVIKFDFTSDLFIEVYFDMLHELEKDGVDFWWIDWQQGSRSNLEFLDPLWALNHYHYYDNMLNNKRGLILSRYSGLGAHRYPLGFSGDTTQDFSILKYQIEFTINASNIGYTLWSHDIGGHFYGIHSNELYVRWLQFGLFNPIMRIHSTCGMLYGKEPWNYPLVEGIATNILQTRSRFIPYVYTQVYKNVTSNIPLTLPLYYKYDTDNAYKYKYEYFFGDILVSPIYEELEKGQNKITKDVYLPGGHYTDIFRGIKYNSEEVTINRYLNDVPAFIKDGSIIFFNNEVTNSLDNPTCIELVMTKGNGETLIFEDDGVSNDYQDKNFITTITQTLDNNTIHLTISGKGNNSAVPSSRSFVIRLLNEQVDKLVINNEESDDFYNDPLYAKINVNECDINKEISIDITLKDFDVKRYLLAQIKYILLQEQLLNKDSDELFALLLKTDALKFKDVISKSFLTKEIINAIFEVIDNIMQ